MRDLVRRCVKPGMTVLDPFCGAATTGIAALSLDCRFIGIDIDQDILDRAAARLGSFDL